MKRFLMFVALLMVLSVPVFAEDWTDPATDGSAKVGAWIAAGARYFVEHYEGIDLLWWVRR